MADEPQEPEDEAEEEAEEAPEEEDEHRRSFFEALVPDLVRRALKEGAEALAKEELRETVVAEVVRKAIRKGSDVADASEESLRRILGELPLPNDVVERIVARFDDYRGDIMRLIREELHEFLEKVDLGHELQKMLTSLSFEITTEIRFIPNEKAVVPKPEVKANVRVKRKGKREGAEE